jgi:DHA3 family macrolide efflux protein-like MFS transporter
MFVVGAAMSLANGPLLASLQAAVEPEMQGRVFTLVNAVATAMTPLGLVMAGPIADAYGAQVWYVLGGLVTIALGLGGFFIPAVVHFEDGRPGSRPSAPVGPVFAAGRVEIE